MNPSASGSGLQMAGESRESGKRAPKANRACVPCRTRKVKCDAAVIGLPCSSCVSRQSTKDCALPVRKGRTTRKVVHGHGHDLPIPSRVRAQTAAIPATPNSSQVDSPNQSNRSNRSGHSKQPSTSDPRDYQSPSQTKRDLLYLNILNDVVKDNTDSSRHQTTSNTPDRPRPDESFTPRNCLWTKLPQLDDIDNEYLAKKGVFDLPPPRYLDALVKAFFEHVYPFSPVINRAEFIRSYQSGDCSLFLLHVILTPASLHVPADVLSACGFASRSAAQESFFTKARLLHDFAGEDDPLLMLQGSIILCMVILDHPTDRDFDYWFHNAIRLATKVDLRNTCIREDKPREVLKLYRRIWWILYFLDVFYVFVNTRRSPLLKNTSGIKPRTEDDWEAEDASVTASGLLSALTTQQKALPPVYCELSRIFGECLPVLTDKLQQDPRQMMRPLDEWRKSLAANLHVGGDTGTNVYYLNILAISYRFECILCRLIRRSWEQSRHADWSEWAGQRLRSAILELDAIAVRVLASGTLQNFPVAFVTTLTALLAIHIESALDPAETDLVRSMARISINQTMLVLTQGKEIPVLKRALPIFEEILTKKNLYLVSPSIPSQVVPARSRSQSQPQENNNNNNNDDDMADAYGSPHTRAGVVVSSQLEEQGGENNFPSFDVDFLGFDFLDAWPIAQLDFTD